MSNAWMREANSEITSFKLGEGLASRTASARCSEKLRQRDCLGLASIQYRWTSNFENEASCRRPPALRSLQHKPEPRIYQTRQQPGAPQLAPAEPPVQHLAGTLPPHSMRESDRRQEDPSAARKVQTVHF